MRYYVSSIDTTAGTPSGSAADTQSLDDLRYTVTEDNSTGLTSVFTIAASVLNLIPDFLNVTGWYSGSGTHYITVAAYDFNTSGYINIGRMQGGTSDKSYSFKLGSADYHDPTTGEIRIRFLHSAVTYNPAHTLNINNFAVEKAVTVNAIWDEVVSPSKHNVKNSAAYKLWRHADTLIHTGIAQGPGSLDVHNQIQLDTDASNFDGAYDPALVVIVAGTGAGQSRNILQYVGDTRMATVDRSWKVDPAADSEFIIVTDAGREHVNEGLAQGGGEQTITLNPQASDHDDAYNAQVVFLRSGPGEDQARRILDYEGATRIATVSRPWTTGHEPTSSTAYVVLPTGAISDNCIGRAVWTDHYGDYLSDTETAAYTLDRIRTIYANQNKLLCGFMAAGLVDGTKPNPLGFTLSSPLEEGEWIDFAVQNLKTGAWKSLYYLDHLGVTKDGNFTDLLVHNDGWIFGFCGGFSAPATMFAQRTLQVRLNNCGVNESFTLPTMILPSFTEVPGMNGGNPPCYMFTVEGFPVNIESTGAAVKVGDSAQAMLDGGLAPGASVADMIAGGIATAQKQRALARKGLAGWHAIRNGITAVEWEGDPWPVGASIGLSPCDLIDNPEDGWSGSWPSDEYRIVGDAGGVPILDPSVVPTGAGGNYSVIGICSGGETYPNYIPRGRLTLTGSHMDFDDNGTPRKIGANKVIIVTTGGKMECAYVDTAGNLLYESSFASVSAPGLARSTDVGGGGGDGIVTENLLRESLFGMFLGAKDIEEITGLSFAGTFETYGEILLQFQTDLEGTHEDVARLTESGFEFLGITSRDAVLRFEVQNIALGGGVLTVSYTGRLDGTAKTMVFDIPAMPNRSECWNILANGQIKACDAGTLYIQESGGGGGGGVQEETIQDLTEAIGNLAAETLVPGTLVQPYEVEGNTPLVLYAYTDNDDITFTVGPQWGPYLAEQDAQVWFTSKLTSTTSLDIQATIDDPVSGIIKLTTTAAQMVIKAGTYGWQLQVRRSVTAGDPPVTRIYRRMMMEGKVYIKPTFKV